MRSSLTANLCPAATVHDRDELSRVTIQEHEHMIFPLVTLETDHRRLANLDARKIRGRQCGAVARLNLSDVFLGFCDEFVMFHGVCMWSNAPSSATRRTGRKDRNHDVIAGVRCSAS